MTEQKIVSYTPGPWRFGTPEGKGFEQRIPIHRAGTETNGVVYAGPHAYVRVTHVTGEAFDLAEANARLIAASPDLLEACRHALENMRGSAGDHQRLQHAIDKAEGR